MYCEKCKKKYGKKVKFCEECGSKLVDELDVYAEEMLNGDKDTFEKAFEKLYQDTHSWVEAEVKQKLQQEQDIEDCVQEFYIKIHRKIELYEPEKGSFRTWFNKVLSNHVIDFWRKGQRKNEKGDIIEEFSVEEEELLDMMNFSALSSKIQMEQTEGERLLHLIIDSLPDNLRMCVKGRYFKAYKHQEIARMLGISESSVKRNLKKAEKEIENRVLQLEKENHIKLYGLAPFAFFRFLLSQVDTQDFSKELLTYQGLENVTNAASEAESATSTISDMKNVASVTENTHSAVATGVAEETVKVAAASAGKTIASKVFIAAVATATIGGGVLGGVKVYEGMQKQGNVAQSEVADTQKQGYDLTDLEPYKEVLEKYHKMMEENWNEEQCLDAGLSDLYAGNKKIGYSLLDVNGDGCEEMFIGQVGEGEQGFYIELYSIVDGHSKLISQSMYQYSHYLCNDYMIEIPLPEVMAENNSEYYVVSKEAELQFSKDAEKGLYSHYELVYQSIGEE